MFTSLRSRLILVGLVALLPLLAFFVQTRVQLQGLLEEGLEREAAVSVQADADHHRVLLEETETILGLLAESTAGLDPALCRPYLASVLERSGYLGVLAIADTAGRLACVAPEAQEGVSVADRDYFRGALATGRPVAGYHVGRVTGDPSLAMAYPMEGPAGERLFLIGGVNLHGVEFLPGPDDVEPGRSVTLFERDGHILHRVPDGSGIDRWIDPRLIPDAGDPEPRIVRAPGADGEEWVYAVAPLVQEGGVADAYMAVGFDPALARAAGRDVLLTNLLGLLLALVFLAAGIWVVMEFAFLRRLEPVLETSRDLAAGDLSARTGVAEGRDEVSRLAGTIDDMAAGLEELRRREASEARAELEESERRFRQLAGSIREIFWLYDVAEKRTIYASPAFEAITGRDPEWVYDGTKSWLAIIHPDDRDRAREFREGGMLGEEEVEYRITRPDGEVRWLRDRSFPVRSLDGRIIRVAGVAQDVTEQKELEEALRRASKLEAIGRLAGGVAHDFNNILTAIGANTQLLMADSEPDSPLGRDLAEIDRGVARAASLTRQLLAFSSQQPLRLRIVDPGRLVRDLLPMLERLLGSDVELVTEVDAAAGPVRVDPNQLETVLVNLAVNARDAMPEGGTIHVRIGRTDVEESTRTGPGPWVTIAVEDTGVGISPEDLPRVFEPFWTTKGPSKGTGLGLASAYGIVQQTGGHIWASSEEGRGSVFTVYLPELDEEAVRAATGGHEAEPEAERSTAAGSGAADLPPAAPIGSEGAVGRQGPADAVGGAGRTILVVEDEDSVLHVARRSLERYGYTVLTASSGKEGLAILERAPDEIDLVVSDIVMPGMGGREVRKRVGRLRPGLPVILMSGYPADREGRPAPVEEEGVPFLPKPFTPSELAGRVAEILDRPSAAKEGSTKEGSERAG